MARNHTQLASGARFTAALNSFVSGVRNGHDVFLKWADFAPC